MKNTISELRKENENLIKEKGKLKDKLDRKKEKNKEDNIVNSQNENDDHPKISNEELETVNTFSILLNFLYNKYWNILLLIQKIKNVIFLNIIKKANTRIRRITNLKWKSQ